MNREIKFRAWDKSEKIMSEGLPFSWFINGEDVDMEFLKTNQSLPQSDLKVYLNDFEFMQFTGLKDKNGKEIYEGDIITIKLPAGGFWGNVSREETGQVLYESDCGGYIVKWEYSKNQHHIGLNCDIAFEGLIIGNIHENPELI